MSFSETIYLTFRDYLFSKKKEDDDGDEDKTKEHVPKMEAKLISFKTFYYLVGLRHMY